MTRQQQQTPQEAEQQHDMSQGGQANGNTVGDHLVGRGVNGSAELQSMPAGLAEGVQVQPAGD